MEDAGAPQAAPLPPTGPNTRAKGKARQDPPVATGTPPITQAQQPRPQKGKKRAASPDAPGEITPKKSDIPPDVPHVQVDEASPPRATQRARTESSVLVATDEVSLSSICTYQWSAHIFVREGVARARRRTRQSAGLRVVQDVSLLPVHSAL
jgi:hypothetical protein